MKYRTVLVMAMLWATLGAAFTVAAVESSGVGAKAPRLRQDPTVVLQDGDRPSPVRSIDATGTVGGDPGVVMRKFRPSTTCILEGIACGASGVDAVLGCAAAVVEAGANPVADVACGAGIVGGIAACASMMVSCDTSEAYLEGATLTSLVGTSVGTNVSSRIYAACDGEDFVQSVVGYVETINGEVRITKIDLHCTDHKVLEFGRNDGTSTQELTCDTGELYTGYVASYKNTAQYLAGFSGRCTHMSKMVEGTQNTTEPEGGNIGQEPGTGLSTYTITCPAFTRLRGMQVWTHSGLAIPVQSEYIVGIQGVCIGAAAYAP